MSTTNFYNIGPDRNYYQPPDDEPCLTRVDYQRDFGDETIYVSLVLNEDGELHEWNGYAYSDVLGDLQFNEDCQDTLKAIMEWEIINNDVIVPEKEFDPYG